MYYCKIQVAGKKVILESNFKRGLVRCKNYLTKFDKPDIIVSLTEDDIQRKLETMRRDDVSDDFDGRITVDYGDIEYDLLCFSLAEKLLDYNMLLLHGSAVAVDNRCYIFTAPSGTGKTTHTNYWLKKIKGSVIINGDKPFIDVSQRLVFGTPWCGKETMNTNTAVFLGGIIAVERGNTTCIVPVSFREILPVLLCETYIPSDREKTRKAYQLIDSLKDVPCYRLMCNMDEASATIAYTGIKAKEREISQSISS